MPTPRGLAGYGVISDKLYVAGGRVDDAGHANTTYATTHEYDPASDTWTAKASMPAARFTAASCVISGKLYVVGGYNSFITGSPNTPFADHYRYDPGTNAWSTLASLPVALSNVRGATLAGKFHTVGGVSGGSTLVATHYVYDPGTNAWTTLAALPSTIQDAQVVTIGGVLYVLGGYSGGGLSTAWAYDATGNSWSTVVSMSTARWSAGTTEFQSDGWVVGGDSTASVEFYDPVSNAWSNVVALPAATFGPAMGTMAGRLFVAGGVDPSTLAGITSSYVLAPSTPLCLFPRNDDLDGPLLPQFHDSSERSARLGGGDTFS